MDRFPFHLLIVEELYFSYLYICSQDRIRTCKWVYMGFTPQHHTFLSAHLPISPPDLKHFSRREPICCFLLDSCGLLTRDVTTGEPTLCFVVRTGFEPVWFQELTLLGAPRKPPAFALVASTIPPPDYFA
jgi:hypothetical protein